ncbi:hypothetical protein EK21DRAFT_91051 [Setomelanomma holmii]|uniref:Uncharacterized protein n=1 Tax=Setomelanomma holmii TaxID=210430 RepID=A0A9P4H5C7_9PLEO|nr:hypothetical protein EK21DRAFT_91051 [Setomelanomma holmii]
MSTNSLRLSITEAYGLTHLGDELKAIDNSILIRHCPLDNGRHAINFESDGASSLGALSKLLVELSEEVIRHVDIETLLAWRRVNKLAMTLVASLSERKKITTHTANTLRMAVGFNVHSKITIVDLFDLLCRKICKQCGAPAPIVDVDALQRFCPNCVLQSFWPVSQALLAHRARQRRTGYGGKATEDRGVKDEGTIVVKVHWRMGSVKAACLVGEGMGKVEW